MSWLWVGAASGRDRGWRRPPVFLALLSAVAGCAALPGERPLSQPTPPQAYASAVAVSAAEADWPSDHWWLTYDDRQLSALIEEGLKGSPDLRMAQARFAAAKAIAEQTMSRERPTLDGQGQFGATKLSERYIYPAFATPNGWKDYSQVNLNLNWDLDFWGRNRAASKAAQLDAAARAGEQADARLALSTAIASAYGDLARLYAERDASADALEVRRKTTDLIHDRLLRGLETDGAFSRALSSQATAEADLADVNEEIALRRNQIAALMGAGPDRGLTIRRPPALNGRTFGLPKNLPLALIARRPDVLASRRRVEAAASRVGAARASFFPDINLSPSIGLQALGIGNLVRSGSDFGSVGPAVDLPIFEGGRLRGQLRQAEAEYDLAVSQYDGALTEALREVADAAASERALSERLSQSALAEAYAQEAFISATNRYRGGLATYLDVLTAEDALITSRRTVASLRTRGFSLDISLTRALGGGFTS